MPTPKLLGELAEMTFHTRCAQLGLRVATPYGDSYPYDSIVDNRHTCWRVQVKSTDKLGRNGLYQVHSGHAVYGNKIQPYHEPDIDFFAFYLFRVNTWYIIPRNTIGTRLSVTLYAPYRRHKGIYSQYFEAWRLLKQPRPCTCTIRVGTIHACADLAYDESACEPYSARNFVIPTGTVASRSEGTAKWRACPELAEGDLLLPLGGAALQPCKEGLF